MSLNSASGCNILDYPILKISTFHVKHIYQQIILDSCWFCFPLSIALVKWQNYNKSFQSKKSEINWGYLLNKECTHGYSLNHMKSETKIMFSP